MTPQLRTALVRKLKNIVPDCRVEFLMEAEERLCFRLVDQSGKGRSDMITINRPTTSILRGQKLEQLVRASRPQGGALPRKLGS